jgi:hypothetical protein
MNVYGKGYARTQKSNLVSPCTISRKTSMFCTPGDLAAESGALKGYLRHELLFSTSRLLAKFTSAIGTRAVGSGHEPIIAISRGAMARWMFGRPLKLCIWNGRSYLGIDAMAQGIGISRDAARYRLRKGYKSDSDMIYRKKRGLKKGLKS